MSENQQPELNYTEFWEEKVNISFRKICPKLAGTIEDQKKDEKGLSIVVFFSKEDNELIINKIISKIINLPFGFIPTIELHSTFLTLTSKESFIEYNNHLIDLIIEQINNFLEERKKKCNLNPIKLNFHEIRPGTWYDKQNRDYPNLYDSNGTVIAIGNKSQSGNIDFVTLADQLVVHLRRYLPSKFKENFKRKFSTVWSTLGYFDPIDFDITKKFVDTFQEFKERYSKQPLPIKIEKLSLVEFTYKDLSDAKILKESEL